MIVSITDPTEVIDLFNYLWQDGDINTPHGDPENGPCPYGTDVVWPVTAKEVWKEAHGCIRKANQGLDPFLPHPLEYEHFTF